MKTFFNTTILLLLTSVIFSCSAIINDTENKEIQKSKSSNNASNNTNNANQNNQNNQNNINNQTNNTPGNQISYSLETIPTTLECNETHLQNSIPLIVEGFYSGCTLSIETAESGKTIRVSPGMLTFDLTNHSSDIKTVEVDIIEHYSDNETMVGIEEDNIISSQNAFPLETLQTATLSGERKIGTFFITARDMTLVDIRFFTE